MSRVEKESGSKNYNTHCFPSIQKSSENLSQRDGHANHSFRPLYQSDDGTPKGQMKDFISQSGSDGEAPIEDAKGETFDKGFEAGKAEACKIVQQELDVPIRQFRNENDRYQECYAQITDTYSDQIVKLTLAISRIVLGKQFELDVDRLEPMRRQLQSFLKEHYQLSMKLNGDDLKALSDIMACDDPQWNQSTALNIIGDVDTASGRIDIDPKAAISENNREKFKQEFEALLTET